MGSIIRRAAVAIVFMTSCIVMPAQQCIPVVLSLNSYVADGGPAWASWTAYNEAQASVGSGLAQFAPNDPSYEHALCLAPGCYGVTITPAIVPAGDGVFVPSVWINGQSLELQNYTVMMGMIGFTFCVDGADCPDHIAASLTEECGTVAFEIGSFVPGEEVNWDFGDGTTVLGGHFITHHFDSPGVHVVYAFYTSDLCTVGVELLTEVETASCPGNCADEISVGPVDCNTFVFQLAGAPEDAPVTWTFGNHPPVQGGVTEDHSFPENGTYSVTAVFLQPGCDVQTFTTSVSVNCPDNQNCPQLLEHQETECGTYVFHIAGAWPNESQAQWYVDGASEPLGTGASFTFQPAAPGCYTVSAVYESDACHPAVTLSLPVCFEGCGDCPTDLHVVEFECNVFGFHLMGAQLGAPITWTFGDASPVPGGPTAEHAFSANGIYPVVVTFDGEGCGLLTFETNVFVNCTQEGNCPEALEIGHPECGAYVAHVAGAWPNEGNVHWYVNGGSEPAGVGSSFTFLPEEPGCYTLTAGYTSEGCGQPVFLTEEVCFEGCVDPDCPSELWASAGECGFFSFETGSFQPGESVDWYFGDEMVENEGHFITHQFAYDGEAEVCAVFSSNACPEGVTLCTTVQVELCPEDCFLEIQAEDMGGGFWRFTAFGNPEVYPMFWNFGDGVVYPATWVVEHQFPPGEHTVCATLEAEACPEPLTDCITIVEEAGGECIEAGISMDSFVAQDGPTYLHWTLSQAGGELVDSGMAQYSLTDPWYDRLVCLPPGCYVLRACGNEVLNEANFNLAVGSPLELVDYTPINTAECKGFEALLSLNGNCGPQGSCEASFEVVYSEQPGVVEFVNTSQWEGDASFTWSFGNGTFANGNGASAAYTSNGTYLVCLHLATPGGLCTDEYCDEVTITGLEEGCPDNLVHLALEGSYPDELSSDLIELVLSTSGFELAGEVAYVSAGFSGELDLCLADGCYTVEVNAFAPIVAEALQISITANGEPLDVLELLEGAESGLLVFGLNADCTIGVGEEAAENALVYPNPASGRIFFSGLPAGSRGAHLHALDGRMVRSFYWGDEQPQADVGDLAPGVYWIRFDLMPGAQRVVVQRE